MEYQEDETATADTSPRDGNVAFRSKILNWLAYAAVLAAVLFFFAPESLVAIRRGSGE